MISVDHGRKPAVQYVLTNSLVDAEANLHRSFELLFFYIIFLRFLLTNIVIIARQHANTCAQHASACTATYRFMICLSSGQSGFVKQGGGTQLTKPGYWSKPHTHSNPTNLALFRHKITLYTFNQGRFILL